MATRPLSAPAKKLAVSITATATSLTLNNIQDWNYDQSTSNVLTSSGSFNSSTSWPAVLKNDDGSQIEFVELDTTTLSGNSMNITKRGLSYVGGTTASEETAYAWNANETTINLGSNPPQLYEQYVDKENAETIAGVKTFSSFPVKSGTTTPTSTSEFATKAYVDSAVSSSLVYAANIISDYGSTSYSQGAVVYYSSSDQLWYPADADLTTSFQNKTLGITQSTSNTSGDSINILIAGTSTSVSTSLTAGTKYFLGNSSGALATTGTNEVYLGYALSSTKFLFEQRRDDMPYATEKDALAGLVITTSAPSASNPYLTAYDSTSAVTTSGALVVRRNSTGDVLVNETPQSSSAAASKNYVDGIRGGKFLAMVTETSSYTATSQGTFMYSSGLATGAHRIFMTATIPSCNTGNIQERGIKGNFKIDSSSNPVIAYTNYSTSGGDSRVNQTMHMSYITSSQLTSGNHDFIVELQNESTGSGSGANVNGLTAVFTIIELSS